MNLTPILQNINSFSQKDGEFTVSRLDLIHPIVSGNKFFKLRYYLESALLEKKNTLVSFGGPYSNHLVALAYLAQQNGLKSIGVVRSTPNEPITATLQEAIHYGMNLHFVGRTHFTNRREKLMHPNSSNQLKDDLIPSLPIDLATSYFIDEGGYGVLGCKGAATIIDAVDTHKYDHIICAVGTGTMMAGLMNGVNDTNKVIGIPILKNEESLEKEIKKLLNDPTSPLTLLPNFHQGGYAKINNQLLEFMNQFWEVEKIPTDIVYTGKLFFAIKQLIDQGYFNQKKCLVIHSGGLQGNRSLPKGTLLY